MTKTVEMVITGAQVLNVYTREFEATSLWIDHGRIISNLRDEPYIAAQHVDATGQWIVPGMIDAHVHRRFDGGTASWEKSYYSTASRQCD